MGKFSGLPVSVVNGVGTGVGCLEEAQRDGGPVTWNSSTETRKRERNLVKHHKKPQNAGLTSSYFLASSRNAV
jgi:hypothetical protein